MPLAGAYQTLSQANGYPHDDAGETAVETQAGEASDGVLDHLPDFLFNMSTLLLPCCLGRCEVHHVHPMCQSADNKKTRQSEIEQP